MSDRRTDEQRCADDFDCDLYRLISRAEQRGWHTIAAALREARPLVRAKMSAEDRERTT